MTFCQFWLAGAQERPLGFSQWRGEQGQAVILTNLSVSLLLSHSVYFLAILERFQLTGETFIFISTKNTLLK